MQYKVMLVSCLATASALLGPTTPLVRQGLRTAGSCWARRHGAGKRWRKGTALAADVSTIVSSIDAFYRSSPLEAAFLTCGVKASCSDAISQKSIEVFWHKINYQVACKRSTCTQPGNKCVAATRSKGFFKLRIVFIRSNTCSFLLLGSTGRPPVLLVAQHGVHSIRRPLPRLLPRNYFQRHIPPDVWRGHRRGNGKDSRG